MESIEFVFSIALFINALLFIPKALRICRNKTAKDVSLMTFGGILAIQISIILHGLIIKDYLLAGGYVFSIITCGAVVILILFYKKQDQAEITFQEILNNLPGHIYWKDEDGVCLGCNTNNWKDFCLKSATDFIGKTDYDVFPKKRLLR